MRLREAREERANLKRLRALKYPVDKDEIYNKTQENARRIKQANKLKGKIQ